MSASLLMIVEVDWDQRIKCQAPGCGRPVYKRIHVVRDDDRIVVVGSDCWARLYAGMSGADGKPRYGDSQGRLISAEERAQLLANTAAFIARIEQEAHSAAALAEAANLKRERDERESLRRDPPRWQEPPLSYPDDPPYVAAEDSYGRHKDPREALAKFREQESRRVALELLARTPAFQPFPERWVARAMLRAKEDLVAGGMKLDEPGSRQRIEADALALLKRHYRP